MGGSSPLELCRTASQEFGCRPRTFRSAGSRSRYLLRAPAQSSMVVELKIVHFFVPKTFLHFFEIFNLNGS